jgi:hypothetical protein
VEFGAAMFLSDCPMEHGAVAQALEMRGFEPL